MILRQKSLCIGRDAREKQLLSLTGKDGIVNNKCSTETASSPFLGSYFTSKEPIANLQNCKATATGPFKGRILMDPLEVPNLGSMQPTPHL